MHPALQRLVEAHDACEGAKRAVVEAEERRRACALDLCEIEDEDERLRAAVWAYKAFGKGLSLVLAEAVTGLPGKKGQSRFLVLAGRKQYQPKGHGAHDGAVIDERSEPMTAWPAPTPVEREVIAAHMRHGQPYTVSRGLGWTHLSASLAPAAASHFLEDPTAALAEHFGIDRPAFVEWLSGCGEVTCEGRFANGKPCTSRVAALVGQLPLRDWIAARKKGGYCARHGG
jgi:hypothetical protein